MMRDRLVAYHGLLLVAIAVATALWCMPAYAHKPSDSYLTLKVGDDHIQGQWDVALRDLEYAIGLDANGDSKITWGELRTRHTAITAYVLPRFDIATDAGACAKNVVAQLVDNHTDGAYNVLRFGVNCPGAPTTLTLTYKLFADLDPQHRGILRLDYEGSTRTAILGPDDPTQRIELDNANPWGQFLTFLNEGIWHIWAGYDHILFLIALLLPCVLYRKDDHWQAVGEFTPAFLSVVKIVSAFTLAHSITLSLAALGIVDLPSRLIESGIAASIVIGALNNVYPVVLKRLWLVAFSFGLLHGFGFASVLADLGLPRSALVIALVGFNVGVEAGQLIIVAAFVPVAFMLRRTWAYPRLVLTSGSLVIAIVAAMWMAERMFNFKILPV
jgi:hypothetical protein